MGTLGHQQPRNGHSVDSRDVENYIETAQQSAKKLGVKVETVIEATRVLELARQNTLAAENGDYTDENLGGFGDKLDQIATAISELAAAIGNRV